MWRAAIGHLERTKAGPRENHGWLRLSGAQQALNTAHRSATARVRGRPGAGSRLADAIADAGLGLDQVAGIAIGIGGGELPPQSRHVDVEVVALLAVGRAPHGAQEPPAREDAARRRQHLLEELVLAGGQVELGRHAP